MRETVCFCQPWRLVWRAFDRASPLVLTSILYMCVRLLKSLSRKTIRKSWSYELTHFDVGHVAGWLFFFLLFFYYVVYQPVGVPCSDTDTLLDFPSKCWVHCHHNRTIWTGKWLGAWSEFHMPNTALWTAALLLFVWPLKCRYFSQRLYTVLGALGYTYLCILTGGLCLSSVKTQTNFYYYRLFLGSRKANLQE